MELRKRSSKLRQALRADAEAEENFDDSDGGKGQRRKRNRPNAEPVEAPRMARVNENVQPVANGDVQPAQAQGQVPMQQNVVDPNEAHRNQYQQQTREIARSMARFYAHYDPDKDDLFEVRDRRRRREIEGEEPEDNQESTTVVPKRKVVVSWTPSRVPGEWDVPVSRPPSLFELSLRKLCENINGLESLDGISELVKNAIVLKLCELGKLSTHTARLVFSACASSIFFPDCTRLSSGEFIEAFDCCNELALKALELGFCGRVLTDDVLNRRRLTQLEKLHLHGAYLLTDASLSNLFRAARGLTDVKLTECFEISDRSIETLAESVGSELRELAIERCDGVRMTQLMRSLLRFRGLQSLSLVGVKDVDDHIITEIMVNIGSTLTKLDISGCNVGDDGMASVAACGSSLTILEVGKLERTTDLSLEKLSETCHALKKISLDGSKNYSDEQLAKFFSACGATMCDVSLSIVRNAGDNTLLALAGHAKDTLLTLDASFCREMTDDGLGHLADSCSCLTQLKLFGCTQVTSKFVMGHSNKSLKILGHKLSYNF